MHPERTTRDDLRLVLDAVGDDPEARSGAHADHPGGEGLADAVGVDASWRSSSPSSRSSWEMRVAGEDERLG